MLYYRDNNKGQTAPGGEQITGCPVTLFRFRALVLVYLMYLMFNHVIKSDFHLKPEVHHLGKSVIQ